LAPSSLTHNVNFSSAFPGPGAPHSRARATSPLAHLYTPSTKEHENYTANNDDALGRSGRVVVKHYRELNQENDTSYYSMACGVCRNKKVKCKLPSILPIFREEANPYIQITPITRQTLICGNFRRPGKARLRILQSKSPLYACPPSPFLSFPHCPNLSSYLHLNSYTSQAKRTSLIAKPSHLFTCFGTGEKS
jgi:hypothetical protein